MLFNVPQYIDIEDKVAGPFTAKQLLWMFGMGAALLVMWGTLDQVTFFICAFPVAALFCALAFYRPQGQPFIRFIFYTIAFLFHPKVYIWKRGYFEKKKQEAVKEKESEDEFLKKKEKNKKILFENIEGLAKTLDTEGIERNEKIIEIIRQNRQIKKK